MDNYHCQKRVIVSLSLLKLLCLKFKLLKFSVLICFRRTTSIYQPSAIIIVITVQLYIDKPVLIQSCSSHFHSYTYHKCPGRGEYI